MKKLLSMLLLLVTVSIFAQEPPEPYSEDKPGNGMCNGHYPGDGHSSMHPCHGNDPVQVPINNKIYIIPVILLGGIFVFIKLKK